MRFSGHDTFHCKEQWLLKGLQLIEKEGGESVLRRVESIPKLGVGKNMVRSIQHWLRSFGLISDEQANVIAQKIFLKDQLDPYLEKEGTLWLLQYFLCKTDYASIYKLIFFDYFSDKASLEFSESQIISFIKRKVEETGAKATTDNTLASDFKVFIKTYVAPDKNAKTVEDDYNTPLLTLNLIQDTGRRNTLGERIYRINKGLHASLDVDVFLFCLLNEMRDNAIDIDKIRQSLGAYLCLSNDAIEDYIQKLTEERPEFIFKDDAGIRQLQVKKLSEDYSFKLLDAYYEVYR